MGRTKKQEEKIVNEKRNSEKQCVCRSSAVTNTDSQLTKYFGLRKRKYSDFNENEMKHLGKRLRKDVKISDAECAQSHGKIGPDDRICTPMGVFDSLPESIFYSFAKNSSLPILVRLSQTSRKCSEVLLSFALSYHGRDRFAAEARALEKTCEGTAKDPFIGFGQLLKAATCTFSPDRRIQIITQFLNKYAYNWAYGECNKMVKMLLERNDGRLKKILEEVTSSSPGTLPKTEMMVREEVRSLLLIGERTDEKEASFYLSALLRSFPLLASQSKILMILFAPTVVEDSIERVDWRSLCERAVISKEDAQTRLAPLSQALLHLHKTRLLQCNKAEKALWVWSDNDLFNIIEEVSTCPEPWSLDNFASLLLQRPLLIPVSLRARMTHGHADEAGTLIVCMKTLLYRWGAEVREVLLLPIQRTAQPLPQPLRRLFYSSVIAAHARNIKDLCNSPLLDLEEELISQQQLHPVLLQAVIF